MSNPVPMGQYAPSNLNMSGMMVANEQSDQAGTYPPIYDVPHGTIQLTPNFHGHSSGAWPFHMSPTSPVQQGTSAGMRNMAHLQQYPHNTAQLSSSPSIQAHPTPQPPMQQRRSSVQTTPRSGFQKVSPKLESPSIGAPGDAKRSAGKAPGTSTDDSSFAGDAGNAGDARSNARKRAVGKGEKESKTGRRKIKIEFIDDDSRRHITFSKRKAGIMKKAYELATLTGTQILLLVVSQTGLVYTFTTPKLEAIVKQPEGRNLIQECLNAPDPSEGTNGSAQNAPGEMYKEEYNDIVVQEEDGDDEEDDDEEGAEFGRADAGLTAQTFGANPIDVASFAHAGSPQLFHPAWVQMNNPAQDSHAGQQIKRRRTQPNLSPMALHSMPGSEMHNQLYPNPGVSQLPNEQHLMHNALPMYYSSMLGANTPATSTAAHDAIGIPQSHASNLPHGMHHMASVLSEQPNNAAHKH